MLHSAPTTIVILSPNFDKTYIDAPAHTYAREKIIANQFTAENDTFNKNKWTGKKSSYYFLSRLHIFL